MPPWGSPSRTDGRAFDHVGVASVELAMLSNRNLLRALDDGALARSTTYAAALLGRPLGDLFARLEMPAVIDDAPDIDEVVKESVRFIENTMTVDRDDRVFPADPAVFTTNAWSVAHGVAGVARALHRLAGGCPADAERLARPRRGSRRRAAGPVLRAGRRGLEPAEGRPAGPGAGAAGPRPRRRPRAAAGRHGHRRRRARDGRPRWVAATGDDRSRERAARLGDHLIGTAKDPGIRVALAGG